MDNISFEEDIQIACYECASGYIHLHFGEVAVQLTKRRFIEFAEMAYDVREVLAADEETTTDGHGLFGLD